MSVPHLASRAAAAASRSSRPLHSESALLRFVAGVRALLAAVCGVQLLVATDGAFWPKPVLGLYMLWSAGLLMRTLRGWSGAGSRLWLWIDVAVLLTVYSFYDDSSVYCALIVLPIVAMVLLDGVTHAIVLALVCVAAMIGLSFWRHPDTGATWSLAAPVTLLALGPAAALLTRPSRQLMQRLQLQDRFQQGSDPRQGLPQHVNLLLGLLASHFEAASATLSLQGLEPRVFLWSSESGVQTADEAEAAGWRERFSAFPHDLGCLHSAGRGGEARIEAYDLVTGLRQALAEPAKVVLRALPPQTLSLPLQSYGQPFGYLCLRRASAPFDAVDLQWVHDLMNETLPLLERSDLLDQLQRETAGRERERIGRDLHDSAVQPYLGLKYGLEALARRAGPDNPVRANIDQLVSLATEELESLRGVVTGLRSGKDLYDNDAPLAALQRQVQRFEALFGLRVHVFAPDAAHLRGSAAKAVLHMVNEALTNVRRHTSATAVSVLIDLRATDVVLRLRNDHGSGEGLPAEFVPRSLTERAAELGGTVNLEHEQNFTEITITLPIFRRQA